jgi:hypothetical protein
VDRAALSSSPIAGSRPACLSAACYPRPMDASDRGNARGSVAMALGCALLGCGCGPVYAPQTASSAADARVAIQSEQSGVSVALTPQGQSTQSAAPAAVSCEPPCLLRTAAGPSEVTVRRGNEIARRSVVFRHGDQRMRVESGNATLRTLGWVSLGATVAAASMAVVAFGYFHTDGTSTGPPPSSGIKAAPQGESPPEWARPMATISMVAVIPLLITGIVLLDQGTTYVGFERPPAAIKPTSRGPGMDTAASWSF